MAIPESLAGCPGNLVGTNLLHDAGTGKPDESPATAVVTSILAGRFLRIDYTWVYRGETQEGSLLVGGDRRTREVVVHWVDTWHMSDAVMQCRGGTNEDGSVSVRGSYQAPPGPDWGWRIDLFPKDEGGLRLVMHNVTPDGEEAPAVETNWARAAGAAGAGSGRSPRRKPKS